MSRRAGVLAVVLAAGAAVSGAAALPAVAAGTNPAPGQPEQPPPATASVGGFHVSGNKIIGPAGNPVIFKGVNALTSIWANNYPPGNNPPNGQLSNAAYPNDLPSLYLDIDEMRTWGFNLVRLFLFDNLWLNATCNPYYQTWFIDAVQRITADGMAAELTLQNGSVSTACNAAGLPMADYPGAVDFWASVANTFKGNPRVIFELYNEPDLLPPGVPSSAYYPYTDLPSSEDPDSVWLNGGTLSSAYGGYQIAGMQQMYDAVRSTGATNLVFVTGQTLGPDNTPGYPYDSIKVALRDPVQGYNIVYATHLYTAGVSPVDGQTCGSTPSLDTGLSAVDENAYLQGNPSDINEAILPVAAIYPVAIDEFGSTCYPPDGVAGQEMGEQYYGAVVSYADEHDLSWAAYEWVPYGTWSPPWCTCTAANYGLLGSGRNPDGTMQWTPSLFGWPVYDDLRDRPCPTYCPYPVFATPPSPGDYEPALTSVANPTVSISPSTAAGASGVDYTVSFDTSQEGLLTSGSWVRIQAPPGTSFYHVSAPKVIDFTSGQDVQAACCVQVGEQQLESNIAPQLPDWEALSPASNEITIPLAGTVSPGDQVVVQLNGVTNPTSGPLVLQVSTSTDRAPVTTNSVPLTPAQSVSALSESLSSSTAGASGVTWTTTFTTSSTGAMSGLWAGGTITITAPVGTDFSSSPGYASLYDLTTGQPVAGGYLTQSEPAGAPATFTFALGSPVAAGDTLQLVVGNVTNPPAGTYSVTVATSSDTVPATSASLVVS